MYNCTENKNYQLGLSNVPKMKTLECFEIEIIDSCCPMWS